MIVRTHRFFLGLSIQVHLLFRLKSNHNFNLTRLHEHLHSDIYRDICVCCLKKINTSCPWLPLFNTDDACVLISKYLRVRRLKLLEDHSSVLQAEHLHQLRTHHPSSDRVVQFHPFLTDVLVFFIFLFFILEILSPY